MVGLISNRDETNYRSEVSRLAGWCSDNNLSLNVEKTKEIVYDFRRVHSLHAPLTINGATVERVSSTKFLGVHITEDLSWTNNTAALAKKAQQRLYFLRKLRRARAPAPIMCTFYRGTIESILTSCITVWYGACNASCRKSLQRIVRAAEKIVGVSLPSLQDIYSTRLTRKALYIAGDTTHPTHSFFSLLPSGRRLRSLQANVCDPDREDSDALEFSLFRSLSPNRVQEVSEKFVEPIVFASEELRPAPEAYGAISFSCGLYDDDVLSTAASESEDLLADTCGCLPPGGQERHSSPSYSELLDMVTRAVDKLGLDWVADAAQAQSQSQSKLDDGFLTSRAPAQPRKPLPSSQTSTRRFRGPGSSRFQRASQTPWPQISPPLLTWRAMVMLRCRRWKRLWLNISRRTRPRLGSLAPSSRRSRVESRRASSGNHTRLQVRQQPRSTRWRCFRPARRSY